MWFSVTVETDIYPRNWQTIRLLVACLAHQFFLWTNHLIGIFMGICVVHRVVSEGLHLCLGETHLGVAWILSLASDTCLSKCRALSLIVSCATSDAGCRLFVTTSCALSWVFWVGGGGGLLSFVCAAAETELLSSCVCILLVFAALTSSIAFSKVRLLLRSNCSSMLLSSIP